MKQSFFLILLLVPLCRSAPFSQIYDLILQNLCKLYLDECYFINYKRASLVRKIGYKPSHMEEKLACLSNRPLCEMINEDLYNEVFESEDFEEGYLPLGY
ncbi:hypothetical protein QR680_013751 [Steinernema hermaphroditum]|uniref:Saposin B-type domain-containing protein n=1 Tax=Steinernema hermaphroditum TaxID=289476 RepID=A0AA39M217_9BILA|nr:hypothetical protein QR680_013751 [Steinernema hermaphroditum]